MQTYIKINLSNIIDNYKKIQEFTNKQIIAIIKDNAYGHGLIQVGKILSSINSFLAVSNIEEAITLRKNMVFSPILLLGREDDAKIIFFLKIHQGVSSLEQLKILAKQEIPISIHLEIETGMFRLGIEEKDIDEAINIIKQSKLRLKGIYTHFCSSDNSLQIEIFKKVLLKFSSFNKLLIHTQASNYINQDLSFCNAIRVGLALYGYSPYLKLKPALKLISPIIRIIPIKANQKIGYDYLESTNEDGFIITIPFGYSLGLSRLKKICFTYQDKTYYQIGKSCMDMMMFFSNENIPIKEIEIISNENTTKLLENNNEIIYYALSSLSSSIKRIYEK